MSNRGTGRNFAQGPGTQSQFGGSNLADHLNKKKFEGGLNDQLALEREKTGQLEKLIYRACLELKRYQDRFGMFHHDEIDDQMDGQFVARADFDLRTLEPLLVSYEDTIKELTRYTNLYKQELANLEDRAQKYVDENQILRRELDKKCTQILSIYEQGDPGNHIANVHTKLLLEDLKDKVRILSDENHSLSSAYNELRGAFREQGGKTTFAESRLDAETKKYIELEKEYQLISKEYDDLRTNHDQIVADSKNIITKQTKASTKANQLEQEVSKLSAECTQYKSKMIEYQRELDETNKKLSQEIENLRRDKHRVDTQCRDLQAKIDQVQNQLSTLEDQNSKLSRDYHTTQVELQQQARLVHDYEERIKLLSNKEELHLKTQRDLNERLDQLTVELDGKKIQVKQLDNQIRRSTQEHEDELSNMIKQQDQQIAEVRQKARQLLEDRDDLVDKLTIESTGFQLQLEHTQKQSHQLKKDIEELQHLIRTDKGRYTTEIEFLKKRVVELEDQVDRREKFHEDVSAGLALDKHALENQNKQYQLQIADLKHQMDNVKKRALEIERQNLDLKEKLHKAHNEKFHE